MRLSPALITENWQLKLTAVGLALLLWTAVRSETSVPYTTQVPVAVQSADPDWVRVAPPAPQQVTVSFTGPVRELIRLALNEPRLVVPIEDVNDTVETHRIQRDWLDLGTRFESLRIDNISPEGIRAFHQPLEQRMVPVRVRLAGRLPEGFVLDGPPLTQPAQVDVRGPRNRVLALDSIPATLEELPRAPGIGTTTAIATVDTSELGVHVSPVEIEVTLPLARRPSADTLARERSAPGGGPLWRRRP